MKKTLIAFSAVITCASASTSFYLASLPSQTEAQKELNRTANTITVAGATTIFGLLDEDDEKSA